MTERGDTVPVAEGILTGTRADGLAYPGTGDMTCGNWTSSSKGRAQAGQHENVHVGGAGWNSAGATRGCSEADFKRAGMSGRFYCFAID